MKVNSRRPSRVPILSRGKHFPAESFCPLARSLAHPRETCGQSGANGFHLRNLGGFGIKIPRKGKKERDKPRARAFFRTVNSPNLPRRRRARDDRVVDGSHFAQKLAYYLSTERAEIKFLLVPAEFKLHAGWGGEWGFRGFEFENIKITDGTRYRRAGVGKFLHVCIYML